MKEKFKSIGGVIGYIIFLGIGIILIYLLFKNLEWIIINVYPLVLTITEILTFIDILIILPMLIFRKLRLFSSMILLYSSYFVGFSLWLYCLCVTYLTLSIGFLIAGLLFGGIGVIPLAFVGLIIQGDWWGILNIVILALITFGLKAISLYVSAKTEKQIQEAAELKYLKELEKQNESVL